MKVSVLIPYKAGDPNRDANWRWLQKRYAFVHPDFEICLGADKDSDRLPFNRGAALNDAAKKAKGEIFYVADADTFVDQDQALRGVEQAALAPGAVVGGHQWFGLTKSATKRLRDSSLKALQFDEEAPEQELVFAGTVSGCVFLSRESWAAVGGFPPGFVGWGFEDNAWWYALETLVAQGRRLGGNIYHMWHPTARKPESPEFQANEALCNEFGAAYGKPEEMKSLLERLRAQ